MAQVVLNNPTLGLAVEGDPAGEHIVNLLQNGISERRLVPGNAGRAIAFHRMIADAFALIRGVGSEAGESVNVRAAAQAEANDALVALNEELAAKLADADGLRARDAEEHATALAQAQEAADATAAELRQQVASLTEALTEAKQQLRADADAADLAHADVLGAQDAEALAQAHEAAEGSDLPQGGTSDAG